MSKFTKGKWEAANFGGYILTHDNEMVVAQVHGWEYLKNKGLSDKEVIDIQNANARLIAAAPELYELLKEELVPTSDYGGILSFAREDKIRKLLARIDDKEAEA